MENMTVGTGVNAVHSRFRVGYDVFRIAGHTIVGSTVYFTLASVGWVPSTHELGRCELHACR